MQAAAKIVIEAKLPPRGRPDQSLGPQLERWAYFGCDAPRERTIEALERLRDRAAEGSLCWERPSRAERHLDRSVNCAPGESFRLLDDCKAERLRW